MERAERGSRVWRQLLDAVAEIAELGEATPLEVARYCARMQETYGSMLFEGKVGVLDLDAEVEMVREIRAAIGPEATLRLDAGVDIIKVKELLGHRHVTTTQIYDKRRRGAREGASHDVPI